RDLGRECILSDGAMDCLLRWEWPGNVRELENVIERSIVFSSTETLGPLDIRIDTGRVRAGESARFLPEGMNLDQYEQSIIREALRRAGGNKSQGARLLGISRNALRYRLSQMGLEDPVTAP
ncbi:MAG: two-component system response regulator, partial [Bryobacteraceae bacterium]|nr:two-component system response regulator [Bryobacteraceae bacterium]